MGFCLRGALICASYSTYWAIIRGGLLFGFWANIQGLTVFVLYHTALLNKIMNAYFVLDIITNLFIKNYNYLYNFCQCEYVFLVHTCVNGMLLYNLLVLCL